MFAYIFPSSSLQISNPITPSLLLPVAVSLFQVPFIEMSFTGKVIAITGAASGIGLALTHHLASLGASLSLADISSTPLENLTTELRAAGTKVFSTTLDVSSSSAVDAWITSTISHFGHLDGAANLAGIGMDFTDVADVTDDLWGRVLAVNLSGTMFCVRAQMRVMQRGASIVNAASMAGVRGRPGLGPYVCAKHGVVGLTRTVAWEVGEVGVRVNAVAP
jgi:NAD(P)-dependent dehydrogenase (short-subunit alcohol dehydrogenase family)